MKNTTLIIGLLAMTLASAPLYAGHGKGRNHGHRYAFEDKARVINVEPIVETVSIPTEHRECWDEEVEYSGGRSRSGAGAIVGSIIGGVAGHQMGAGNGKKVATVAGTAIGAVVGSKLGKRHRSEPYTETERHCRVTRDYYDEERIIGYWVTMRYRGEKFTQRMDYDPGKFVPVRVAIVPLIE